MRQKHKWLKDYSNFSIQQAYLILVLSSSIISQLGFDLWLSFEIGDWWSASFSFSGDIWEYEWATGFDRVLFSCWSANERGRTNSTGRKCWLICLFGELKWLGLVEAIRCSLHEMGDDSYFHSIIQHCNSRAEQRMRAFHSNPAVFSSIFSFSGIVKTAGSQEQRNGFIWFEHDHLANYFTVRKKWVVKFTTNNTLTEN